MQPWKWALTFAEFKNKVGPQSPLYQPTHEKNIRQTQIEGNLLWNTITPQKSQGCEKPGKTEKPSWARGHEHRTETLCGILSYILEQKNISGHTGEIQITSGVELEITHQCWFLSFDGYTMVI